MSVCLSVGFGRVSESPETIDSTSCGSIDGGKGNWMRRRCQPWWARRKPSTSRSTTSFSIRICKAPDSIWRPFEPVVDLSVEHVPSSRLVCGGGCNGGLRRNCYDVWNSQYILRMPWQDPLTPLRKEQHSLPQVVGHRVSHPARRVESEEDELRDGVAFGLLVFLFFFSSPVLLCTYP